MTVPNNVILRQTLFVAFVATLGIWQEIVPIELVGQIGATTLLEARLLLLQVVLVAMSMTENMRYVLIPPSRWYCHLLFHSN